MHAPEESCRPFDSGHAGYAPHHYQPIQEGKPTLSSQHDIDELSSGHNTNEATPVLRRRRTQSTRSVTSPYLPSKVSKRPGARKRLSPAQGNANADANSNVGYGTAGKNFPCVFATYGCAADFGSKNEWKRHVNTQHMRLGFWRCDQCPQMDRKPNDFNRKDLFVQHLRRMHPIEAAIQSEIVKPAKRKMHDDVEEQTLAEAVPRCFVKLRTPPVSSSCVFCDATFEGFGKWEERMEHVGRHMEAMKKGREDPLPLSAWRIDEETEQWLVAEGLVRKSHGQLVLVDLAGDVDAPSVRKEPLRAAGNVPMKTEVRPQAPAKQADLEPRKRTRGNSPGAPPTELDSNQQRIAQYRAEMLWEQQESMKDADVPRRLEPASLRSAERKTEQPDMRSENTSLSEMVADIKARIHLLLRQTSLKSPLKPQERTLAGDRASAKDWSTTLRSAPPRRSQSLPPTLERFREPPSHEDRAHWRSGRSWNSWTKGRALSQPSLQRRRLLDGREAYGKSLAAGKQSSAPAAISHNTTRRLELDKPALSGYPDGRVRESASGDGPRRKRKRTVTGPLPFSAEPEPADTQSAGMMLLETIQGTPEDHGSVLSEPDQPKSSPAIPRAHALALPAQSESDIREELQQMRSRLGLLEQRLRRPSQEQRKVEAVLRMVWKRLVTTGDAEAQPEADLWNLVASVTPNVISASATAAAPTQPFEPTTDAADFDVRELSGQPSNVVSSGVGKGKAAAGGPRTDSAYGSGLGL